MAEKLQALQNANVFFPDAKVTNWLLDSNNEPVIADEKSLRTFEQAQTMGDIFVRTPGYWPPGTVNSKTSEDFEKIHAYILGANIYDYLTSSEPPCRKILADLDFKAEVFNGIIGHRYKFLILNLTNPDLSLRMGLEAATKELIRIKFDDRLEKLYPHGKVANRFLAYNANVDMLKGCDEFKKKYQGWKGSYLKRQILKNLITRIDEVTTLTELNNLKIQIMGDKTNGLESSPEFKILIKHQGLISNVFRKTTSHQALEKIFDDKEASLSPSAAQSTRK